MYLSLLPVDSVEGNYHLSKPKPNNNVNPRALYSQDPSLRFPETNSLITSTIRELGGKVFPKLNWSAPKDATWISPTNSLECCSASDVYLLLKSSDFITHDLEHPFDDCVEDEPPNSLPSLDDPVPELLNLNVTPDATTSNAAASSPLPITPNDITYHLVLRKYFTINPSVEFRVFVKSRKIIGVTQRDLNHYEFLQSMTEDLLRLIQAFFAKVLKQTFPDPNCMEEPNPCVTQFEGTN